MVAGSVNLNGVNALRPSDAYMCQWTWLSLVKVMAWCLYNVKPLPEPMLTYCHLTLWEQSSVKFESNEIKIKSPRSIWKCCLQNVSHIFAASLGYWDDLHFNDMTKGCCLDNLCVWLNAMFYQPGGSVIALSGFINIFVIWFSGINFPKGQKWITNRCCQGWGSFHFTFY